MGVRGCNCIYACRVAMCQLAGGPYMLRVLGFRGESIPFEEFGIRRKSCTSIWYHM